MERVAIRNKGVQSQIGNIFIVVNRGVPRACYSGKWVQMNDGHLLKTAGGGLGFPSPRRIRSQRCIKFGVFESVGSTISNSSKDKGALIRMVRERRGMTLSTLPWEVGSKKGLFDLSAWGLKITK
ncbi:S ribonuclease [Pyrus ussuriensis x Pyrus communis]|uniref:S ribonuclease n=1 Tax=Pyrus ussuriensis x Pyrus communis TaxID=2448454 RepID=A0A5N5GY26_9ROSA|nr:S ribonuclease [Pyrus ussuriensis x Pyrus communis]